MPCVLLKSLSPSSWSESSVTDLPGAADLAVRVHKHVTDSHQPQAKEPRCGSCTPGMLPLERAWSAPAPTCPLCCSDTHDCFPVLERASIYIETTTPSIHSRAGHNWKYLARPSHQLMESAKQQFLAVTFHRSCYRWADHDIAAVMAADPRPSFICHRCLPQLQATVHNGSFAATSSYLFPKPSCCCRADTLCTHQLPNTHARLRRRLTVATHPQPQPGHVCALVRPPGSYCS